MHHTPKQTTKIIQRETGNNTRIQIQMQGLARKGPSAPAVLQLVGLAYSGVEDSVRRPPACGCNYPCTYVGKTGKAEAGLCPGGCNAPRSVQIACKCSCSFFLVSAPQASPIPGGTAGSKLGDEAVGILGALAVCTKHKAVDTTITQQLARNRSRSIRVARDITELSVEGAGLSHILTGDSSRPPRSSITAPSITVTIVCRSSDKLELH